MHTDPQNRDDAGPPPRADHATRFKPGQSGNPGGKVKGLAAAVRDLAPAHELARWYAAIWNRNEVELATFGVDPAAVTLTERNKAGEWLSERGYGKAPAFAPVEGGDPLERNTVEHEIAGLVDELGTRREADAARRAPQRSVEAERQAGADTASG